VSEHDLERRLRSAMRPVDPGEDFCERVLARIEASAPEYAVASGDAPIVRITPRVRPHTLARWGSLSLAACVIAGIGLMHWRQEVQQQRGLQASEQLLQAMNIVSAQLNDVRASVSRQQEPPR
jgi:hypothetical protein